MTVETYRDKLNDLQLEVEELRAKLKEAQTGDLISRQAALDAFKVRATIGRGNGKSVAFKIANDYANIVRKRIEALPSVQPESTRTFVELVVEYPDPELCTYKEYRGKPYYSIKYIENGEKYVGYGTYNPGVLSRYLKEYFISSGQPESEHTMEEFMYGQDMGNPEDGSL